MTSRAITWKKMMTDLKIVQKDPENEKELEDALPTPVGYRVLVALPEVEETFGESRIIKSSKEQHLDHVLSTIGLVVDMGTEAYSDKERFTDGPWCKEGDYVMFRANTGTRFKVGNTEFRLMNDDSIEAVVADPRAVARA
jgi:co-chaperonin GroES (HSP10)